MILKNSRKGGMDMGSALGTIVVGIFLLAIVAAVIGKMISDKKKGKGSCSCGCENCNKCH